MYKFKLWTFDLRRMAIPCKCEREQICRQGSECVSKMSRHNRAFQDWIAPRFTKQIVMQTFIFTSCKMFRLQIRLSLFLTVPNQGFQIGSDLYCYIDTMMQ